MLTPKQGIFKNIGDHEYVGFSWLLVTKNMVRNHSLMVSNGANHFL
jgi:hypothetical protein